MSDHIDPPTLLPAPPASKDPEARKYPPLLSEVPTPTKPSPETIKQLIWLTQHTTAAQWICLTWMTQKVILSDVPSFTPARVVMPLLMFWPWQFILSIYMEIFRLCMFAGFLNPRNTEAARNVMFRGCSWMRMYQIQPIAQYGVGGVVLKIVDGMMSDAVPSWLKFLILAIIGILVICGLLVSETFGDSFFLNTGYKRLLLHVNALVKALIVGLCWSTGAVGRIWFVAFLVAWSLFLLLDAAVYRRERLPRRLLKFVFSEEFPGVYYGLLMLALGFMIGDLVGSAEDIATRLGRFMIPASRKPGNTYARLMVQSMRVGESYEEDLALPS